MGNRNQRDLSHGPLLNGTASAQCSLWYFSALITRLLKVIIMAATVDKQLLGLLNGIAKREYYGECEISDEFLREELYDEMDETSFENHLKRFKSLIKTMANSDMDFRQLEAFLTSQMKRRDGAITEEQVLYSFIIHPIILSSLKRYCVYC